MSEVSFKGGDRVLTDRALPLGIGPGMVTYRRGDRGLDDRGIGNVPIAGPPAGVHLLNGIVSYWTLDETGTADRVDSVGGNNLTDYGTVSAVTGVIGNAAFLGSASIASRLYHASNASLQVTGDFTFSLWTMAANWTLGTIDPSIVNKNADVAGSQEYGVYHQHTAGFVFYVNDPNSYGVAVGTPAAVNTWYHVVAWYDSSDQKMRIRINDTTTYVSSMTAPLVQTTADFSMGARSDNSNWFIGYVDEVGFWKRKLTAAEITKLYNGGAGWAFSNFTN